MASKTQKRQAERRKEELKEQEERWKNLSENDIIQLENYVTFQILYINDAAYNACKFLEPEIRKIPYKSSAVMKVYCALMKNWQRYQDFVSQANINQESVAALFGEMDEYIDDTVVDITQAIRSVLEKNNVELSDYVAQIESAYLVCDYASKISKTLIEKIVKKSKRIVFLIPLIIDKQAHIMGTLADMIAQIHVKNTNIDLNNEPTVMAAFNKFNKSFINATNFKNAQEVADEENIAEGRMTIM